MRLVISITYVTLNCKSKEYANKFSIIHRTFGMALYISRACTTFESIFCSKLTSKGLLSSDRLGVQNCGID
jgi:hypothetical protein